jgi:phosphotransferase family enzyme
MIDAVRTWLGDNVPGFSTDPDATGVILLAADRHPEAKVTMLVLAEDGRPVAVVKVGRGWSSELALAAEHGVLVALREAIGDPMAGEVPQALAFGTVQNRLALAQTPLAGAPLTTKYYTPGHVGDQALVAHDFAAVGGWLRRFREETRAGDVVFDEDGFERWIGSVFSRYWHAFGRDGSEMELLESLRVQSKSFHGCAVPMGGSHGDFAIANILFDEGNVSGVVDWELGKLGVAPFADICKFPTSYSSYLDRAAPSRRGGVAGHPERDMIAARWSRYGDWANLHGIAYGFFGRGWYPSLVESFVSEQLRELDVPRSMFRLFFAAFLAEQAMTLPDPIYRQGYRQVLQGFAVERDSWLWREKVPS